MNGYKTTEVIHVLIKKRKESDFMSLFGKINEEQNKNYSLTSVGVHFFDTIFLK